MRKHLTHDSLAGPFFTFFIPLFYYFQGYSTYHPVVFVTSAYVAAVSGFCESSAMLVCWVIDAHE